MFVLFVIPAEVLQAIPVSTKLSKRFVPDVLNVPLIGVVLTLTILIKTEGVLFNVVIALKSNDL